jgi:hypothetical protein
MTDPRHLSERLAELEHEQWSAWARALLAEEPGLSAERAQRWRRDLVPYRELPEARKELDRAWARRVIAIITAGRSP